MQIDPRMQELQRDPIAMGRNAGFEIPDGLSDPKDIVMHLVNSGQVRGPMLQRIMPMMQRMGWK